MKTALTASMTSLALQLRKTPTWDRGTELAGHADFTITTGTEMFFAEPHLLWQRPTTENTSRLCCASTFLKALTCPDGTPTSWKPSPGHSITGPEKSSGSELQQRFSQNRYNQCKTTVLQPLIEALRISRIVLILNPAGCPSSRLSGLSRRVLR